MDLYSEWSAALANAFSQLLEKLLESLPNVLGALVLLLVGWLAARLLRAVGLRLARALGLALYRLAPRRGVPARELPAGWGQGLANLLFWIVILFFVTASSHVLGLEAFSQWLDRIVAHIPLLLAAGLIVLAGYLVSALARDLVVATAPVAEGQKATLGRVAQATILITAIIIGLDQIGVDITFVMVLASVAAGALLGGLALALSLGARTYVGNLMGGRDARQFYKVGQRVKIGAYEGKILELAPTFVVLESKQGRVMLPAKLFSEEPSVLRMEKEDHG